MTSEDESARPALALPCAAQVEAARASIRGFALRTPLVRLRGADSGRNIFLKLENLQPWGSFKIRPALAALKSMDRESLRRGVLSASAGNFGQGLAFAARELGVPATVAIPEGAAATKAAALVELGATIVRLPFEAWWTALTGRRLAGVEGVFIHPVAETSVLAGNATIGLEILEDLPDLDTVLVPFGGGGLACGIGSVLKRLRPGARLVLVESEAARPAAAALEHGQPTQVPHRRSFVDGMGSSTVLEEMWPLLRTVADRALCVSFAEITDAIRLLAHRHHVIAEAAGAAALAGALAAQEPLGNTVCIVSGGNLDPDKLSAILSGRSPF